MKNMSCMVMNPKPLAALANAIASRLNCGYDFWGFDAPDSLFLELSDCKTVRLYDAKAIYRKLYALNIRAYNGRYGHHEEPADAEAPDIDTGKYIVHHGPEYREHGFAVRPWHYHLAQLLDFWLYQTLEDAVRGDPLRQAVRDFRDYLYAFIIRNSPPYYNMRWGRLPDSALAGNPCRMCDSAYTNPELDSDHDLSYISIGECVPGYRMLFRSGDGRPTEILFEMWKGEWKTIGFYRPKFCPNCGRELRENANHERKGDHHCE